MCAEYKNVFTKEGVFSILRLGYTQDQPEQEFHARYHHPARASEISLRENGVPSHLSRSRNGDERRGSRDGVADVPKNRARNARDHRLHA